MKKIFFRFLQTFLFLYVLLCLFMYIFQEGFIFHPRQLPQNYDFRFNQKFEEINIEVDDRIHLNGLLFKSDTAKGLIFYLHGNAGSIERFGRIAETYTNFNYDIFMIDYRGFGKSEGSISSQKQFFNDLQVVYEKLLESYNEDEIVILGFSLGTAPAAKIASENNPKLLILQAPFYSLIDMMRRTYPFLPTFILKYRFETYKYIEKCEMPVVVFHGTEDRTVHYKSSLKLREHFKAQDTLITLDGQGHNGMRYNNEYLKTINKLLRKEYNVILQ